MSYTNSACRTRVKDSVTKFVYDVHGCSKDDVKATLNTEENMIVIEAHRGPHYNYSFVNTLDECAFAASSATVKVTRGILTLTVPYEDSREFNGMVEIPVN